MQRDLRGQTRFDSRNFRSFPVLKLKVSTLFARLLFSSLEMTEKRQSRVTRSTRAKQVCVAFM
jgi:hypothetical protein